MKRWCKCAAVLMALVLLCGLLPLGVLPVAAASVNRIQNGDFENQLDGRTVHQSTVKVSTTAKYEDAYGLVAKGNGGWGEVVSQSIQLTPNSDYIIRYTVKAVSNGINFVVSDPVGIADGNQHARLYTSYYSTSKGTGWTTVEAAFHSGANDSADFILYGSGKGTTDEIWVDNIAIERIGGDDPIPNRILSGGETSISEDVSGLAFLFNVAADGIVVKEGTFVQADFTNATYNGYKLIGLGVKASNGVSETNIEGLRMYDLEEGNAKFAFRVINIPADKLDVEITMTPYYIVEIDGVATTIEGEAVVGSYAEIAG